MFDVSVVSQLSCLTGCTAQVYLEYIQRNLPEGVAMEVKKVSEFVKRHYANTVQSSPFTNYLFIRSDCHGKCSRPHSGTHVEGWTQSGAKPVTLVMIILWTLDLYLFQIIFRCIQFTSNVMSVWNKIMFLLFNLKCVLKFPFNYCTTLFIVMFWFFFFSKIKSSVGHKTRTQDLIFWLFIETKFTINTRAK